ncbi:sensor domain-containing protein [Helicovermis profundi]|uniref:Uncharacterized protein n=1 Tax=Helicovermis profundi TaxID=3065157 RepID=A0AAU9ETA6_9FIRM|nr:hypothetical protein HLPR_20110 [Clostridia bacterium S502]
MELVNNASIKKIIDDLQFDSNLYKKIYDNNEILILIWNSDGEIIFTNEYFLEKLGYSKEIIGKKWTEFLIPEFEKFRITNMISRLKKDGKFHNHENQIRTKYNHIIDVLWSNSLILDESIDDFAVVSIGIIREKHIDNKINEFEIVDPITKLGNNYTLRRDVVDLYNAGVDFTLYLMGLDNFKLLNNIHGHKFGNEYLMKIADEFKNISNIGAYRGYGDGFIFIEKTTDYNDIIKTIDRINKIVNKKITLENFDYSTTCSVGITTCSKDGSKIEELHQDSDIALNEAKKRGKNNHVFYNIRYKTKIKEEQLLFELINKAIARDEFKLNFQPIFNIETKKIKDFEILLRWPSNPTSKKNIGYIIGLAEKTNQIIEIDKWVVERTFSSIKEVANDNDKIKFSLNISTKSFYSNDFIQYLKDMIDVYGINPEQIIIEITEYSIIRNVDTAFKIMKELKKIGFIMSLDDFGTEYSSLNYLSKLPFDILKLDKSYIDRIVNENKAFIIVKSIINLSKELGLITIAEGIETEKQLSLLKTMKCELGQGYLISKPLNKDEMLSII